MNHKKMCTHKLYYSPTFFIPEDTSLVNLFIPHFFCSTSSIAISWCMFTLINCSSKNNSYIFKINQWTNANEENISRMAYFFRTDWLFCISQILKFDVTFCRKGSQHYQRYTIHEWWSKWGHDWVHIPSDFTGENLFVLYFIIVDFRF